MEAEVTKLSCQRAMKEAEFARFARQLENELERLVADRDDVAQEVEKRRAELWSINNQINAT